MNIHLSFTDVKNESRIFKEAKSLISNNIFNKIIIVGYHSEGLEKTEELNSSIIIKRFTLPQLGYLPKYVNKAIRIFVLWLRFFILCIKTKPKVINVHALELMPIGIMAKFFTGSKLIYDAHELETERIVLRGFIKKIAKILERVTIKHADLTIVVGPMIEEFYRDLYKDINIITVRNCPEYETISDSNSLRHSFDLSNDTQIYLYSGALNKSRNIPLLLSFFSKQDEESRVIIFMGKGPLENLIREAPGYQKTIFHKPAVSPEMVTVTAASADVGIFLCEDECLSYKLCLPNKMFEYIMARIPLLVTNLPEMQKVVSSHNIGQAIDELHDEAILDAMKRIEKVSKKGYKKNLDRAAVEFNWEKEEKVLIKAVKKII